MAASSSSSAMDLDLDLSLSLPPHTRKDLERQLLQAASSGNLSLFKDMEQLLKEEGKTIAQTMQGITSSKGLGVLHCAAAAGKHPSCQYLIKDLGIPVDVRSAFYPTSLFGDLAGGTALHHAANGGDRDTVAYLISEFANRIAIDRESSTPLHCAARSGHVGVVELLLRIKVPVDPVNHNGTPLHEAASNGHDDVVNMLLQYNADVNNVRRGTSTPLTCSIEAGSLSCALLLIKAPGADLNMKCPLGTAARHNQKEILESLLKAGADANIVDQYGCLPIETAALLERKEMVETLISYTDPILELTKLEPGDGKNFASRSLALCKVGFGKLALDDGNRAISLSPKLPRSYVVAGSAFILLQEYKKAGQCVVAGLCLDPFNEELMSIHRHAAERWKASNQMQ